MFINFDKKIVISGPYKTGTHTVLHTIPGRFICHQHGKYTALKKQFPELYLEVVKDYTKYLIVRNPWSHAVSWYMHSIEYRQNRKLFEEECDDNYKANFCSFKNFLKSKFYISQSDITFNDKLFTYDQVIKFENLNNELKALCKKLDYKYKRQERNLGKDPKKQYYLNKQYPEDYRQEYDEECIELVRTRSNKEIELFDYSF